MVKKDYLGVLNFMLVYGQVAWNMSCKITGIIRTKLNNQMWRVCIADLMLQWKDLHDISYNSPESVEIIVDHEPKQLGKEWRGKCPRCLV